MSVKYAIRKRLPDVPLNKEEQYMVDTQGYVVPEDKFSYEEVPAIVAEVDTENGVSAVFSSNGMKLSQWAPLKKSPELEKLWALGASKPGKPLKDSIGQDVQRGDYIMTHATKQTTLELSRVIRTTGSKVIAENLSSPAFSSTAKSVKPRDPKSVIRIPYEMIDGFFGDPLLFEKRYAIRNAETIPYIGIKEEYLETTNVGASKSDLGHFAYFNGNQLISGWIPYSEPVNSYSFEAAKRRSKIERSLEVPFTDAMGTDIRADDWVFSNDNHAHGFSLCRVIGFTKNRVRLVGYKEYTYLHRQGHGVVSDNWPKNIVKIPVTIYG